MAPVEKDPRAVTAIDHYIGVQIRARRIARGLSQDKLAELIGLTFQQVQKYEKGVNRVSAATLCRIAKELGVRIDALTPPTNNTIADESIAQVSAFAELAPFLPRLNPEGRQLLIEIARTLVCCNSLCAAVRE